MSLLSEAMVSCVMLVKTLVPDGYGGYKIVWVDGTTIQAAIVLNSSIEARIAQASGVNNVYTITVAKSVPLAYHDVMRRVSDSKIFRVTSDGSENKTPASAGLDMRQVTAEEWVLPNEQSTSD